MQQHKTDLSMVNYLSDELESYSGQEHFQDEFN